MHHAPPLSQRPSSRVKTPAIRGFLTRDNVILTCPAAQSGENGLITDAHIQPGCGIHVVWSGTGAAGVTDARFAYPAWALQPQTDRKYGTDGAVVADAL